MAPNARSIFVEEDNSDVSVNSNTTASSEAEAEYSVEHILAERRTEDGTENWLVKWEGYPLHRCTWEPWESFVDGNESLKNWAHRKRAIKRGEVEAFDVQRYEDAVNEQTDLRNQRIAKREEKRRKKAGAPRRLLTGKERKSLLKKGTARKAERIHDSSSDSESSPVRPTSRRKSTPRRKPTEESATPTRSTKRKRLILESPPSPEHTSPDVNDVISSQFSLFNNTESTPPRPANSQKAPQKVATLKSSGLSAKVGRTLAPTVTDLPASKTAPSGFAQITSKPKVSVKESPISNGIRNSNNVLAKTPAKASPISNGVRASNDVSVSKPNNKNATTVNASSAKPQKVPDKILPTSKPDTQGPTLASAPTKKDMAFRQPTTAPARSATTQAAESSSTTQKARRTEPSKALLPPKKRHQRERVNEYTPKDSANPQFGSLSQQWRFQRYGNNEPAPDPSALKFIDPTTGKPIEKDAAQGAEQATNPNPSRPGSSSTKGVDVPRSTEVLLNNVLGSGPRLDTTVDDPRPGGPLPDVATRPSPVDSRTSLAGQESEFRRATGFAYPSARAPAHTTTSKLLTCRFWFKTGDCKHGEHCAFSHYNTGRFLPKVNIVCTYWAKRKGGCQYPDDACEYLHEYPTNNITNNGSERQAYRRSESPDHSGLRQDEAERRGRPRQSSAYVETVSTATLFEVPVRLSLTSQETSSMMDIRLQFDEKASRTKLLDRVGKEPLLACHEICTSHNFEAYWYQKDRTWTSGNVLHQSKSPTIDALIDYLILNSAGAIIRNEDYVMVIYPTDGPGWKFFPNAAAGKAALRFYVQTAMPAATQPIAPVKGDGHRSSFAQMCETHLDLKADVLFAGNNGKLHERAVFMFFPENVAAEYKIISTYLEETKSRVYPSSQYDLWTHFCKEGKAPNRVILFHPSMREYWKIPNFSHVLTGRSDNIYQIGVDRSVRTRPEAATKYTCVRLFPNGSLTLITDDIFKYHPDLACEVLESFLEITKPKPQGGRYDRICTRPGLLAWLAQLIDEDHEAGKLTENSDRIKVWQLCCTLMALQAAETNNDAPFSNPPVLYTPSNMPEYTGLWDSSEPDATDYLVEWFCGLCIDERENFRRFTVLYEQHKLPAMTPGVGELKDPKEWMKKAQHVKVTTPQRYLAYLGMKKK